MEDEWSNSSETSSSSVVEWNTGSLPSSPIPFFYDLDMSSGESDKPNVIFFENPEDMLKPATRNPIFYQIVITHAVTFVVGIIGNLFSVFVMIGERKTRTATNLFLVSLAVADLLLLLLCVPLEILQYFLQIDENEFCCKLTKFVLLLSATASVLNLCAVSFERFIVIVFPMRSRSVCTLSNCRKAICVVWVVATILSLPVILIKDGYIVTYTNNITSVDVYYCESEEAEQDLPFAIYQFVILFAAPGLLMMICYFFVIRELWRSTRNINLLTNSRSFHGEQRTKKNKATGAENGEDKSKNKNLGILSKDKKSGSPTDSEKSPKYQKCETGTSTSGNSASRKSLNHLRSNHRGDDVKKARKQVIKMLILVIILFLICWGPKLMLAIALKMASKFDYDMYTPILYNIRVIFSLIPFIHSCFNPVIYSFMSKNFRRSMTRQLIRLSSVLGCNCKCAKKNVPNRNDNIPLRSAIGRTRKPHGPDSTFSSNYYSVSEAASTRHTEVHGITTI